MRTLLNAARSTTVSLCAHTNSPTYTVSGSDTSAISRVMRVSPNRATDIRYTPSRRSSCTTVYGLLGMLSRDFPSSVIPPVARRNWSDASPSPCSAAVTCALLESSEGRMLQPIFLCGSSPAPMNRARVERMKLPVIRFHTK